MPENPPRRVILVAPVHSDKKYSVSSVPTPVDADGPNVRKVLALTADLVTIQQIRAQSALPRNSPS